MAKKALNTSKKKIHSWISNAVHFITPVFSGYYIGKSRPRSDHSSTKRGFLGWARLAEHSSAVLSKRSVYQVVQSATAKSLAAKIGSLEKSPAGLLAGKSHFAKKSQDVADDK